MEFIIRRRHTRLLAALSAVAVLGAGSVLASPRGPTTADRTIVATDERALAYGPADDRVSRSIGRVKAGGKERPLAGFKQISDIHVIDEESPGRVEFFDLCSRSFAGAYRVQEALSTQVAASSLAALNRVTRGPGTGVPLTFTIATGDNIDNNQLNELRWFVDLLDGGEIHPDSGAAGYDGYRLTEFSQALPDDILERAQAPFDSPGAGQPWYFVFGNHDDLIQGTVTRSLNFQVVVTSNQKVFQNLEDYQCPDTTDPDALTDEFTRLYFESSREVPADGDRKFLDRQSMIEELFDTTGAPRGHGLAAAPRDPYSGTSDAKAGYYQMKLAPEVVGLSLDTVALAGGASGQIDDAQFRWLAKKLKANSRTYYSPNGRLKKNRKARDKLIVVFSHHTSRTLRNTTLPDQVPEGMLPLHCFARSDASGCEDGEGLGELLTRFPNVVAWVNGHEHNNRIDPLRPSGDAPGRGLWEINTASGIDWPQQSRLVEIAYQPGKRGKRGAVVIYATPVDHDAHPDPSATPDELGYLASLARIEAHYDACVRPNQAKCEGGGDAEDRSVRLTLKAPFKLRR